MGDPDEILTVLVLYEMRLEFSPAYQSLSHALTARQEKRRLFIYDNSRAPQSLPEKSAWSISYIHDPTNPGVSRAYNTAARWAKDLQLKWLLLSDQDTFFPENIYTLYRDARRAHPGCHAFAPRLFDKKGLVSPFHPGIVTGKRIKENISGVKSLDEIQAINSGLMIDVETFASAGGYDEQFPLDFSDFNFFKRLKPVTQHMVIIDAQCKHELSSTKKTTLSYALSRFEIYLRGLNVMKNGQRAFLFTYYGFFRAIKLSFRYRSGKFIRSFLASES